MAYLGRSRPLAAGNNLPRGMISKLPQRFDQIQLQNPRFTQAKEGKTVWKLTAKSASYDQKKGTIFLISPKMTFYLEKNKYVVLTADRGRMYAKAGRIVASGRVHAVTDDGQHLYTQTLLFNNKTRLIHTVDPVHLTGPRMNVRGIGMRCQVDLRRVQILNRIRTDYNPGRNGPQKPPTAPKGAPL